jgi:hypothetical protein
MAFEERESVTRPSGGSLRASSAVRVDAVDAVRSGV